MTDSTGESSEELLRRLLATRQELYHLSRVVSTEAQPLSAVGTRLLDSIARLDEWFLQLTDRLATLDVQKEQIALLKSELEVAETWADNLCPPVVMHATTQVRVAPAMILDPDPDDERSREAVERVVNAYHRATECSQAPAPSMWDGIEAQSGEFLKAVHARDLAVVQETLARMFQTGLIWGLGRVHESMPIDIRKDPERSGPQLHLTDALVSLAEATGATNITNIEQQGLERHLQALDTELDSLVASVEEQHGLDVSAPRVGAAYGCKIAGKFVTIDSLVHSYAVYRLRQIGAETSSRIVEIGGGYGALAAMFMQNGFTDYTVVDLPWVNLLQGYYLIMGLAPDTVSLFGEPERGVKVLPHWTFGDRPDRSVDYVINTDSLPEMGAETALQYLTDIARILRGRFLSINQEARAWYPGIGRQNWPFALASASGGLTLLHRNRGWMRQGYVEEIYAPKPSAASDSQDGEPEAPGADPVDPATSG